MTGPLGNIEFCFPRIETKIHCSPWDQSLGVKYITNFKNSHKRVFE